MKSFIAKYRDKIIGVLNGFDRLILRGTLRQIAFVAGMQLFLNVRRVRLKDFSRFAQQSTDQVKAASERRAESLHRPVIWLPSSRTDKEAMARRIVEKDRVGEGLIAVFKTLETCTSFDVFRNAKTHQLDLVQRPRKCLHYYHYLIDPRFGFMHVRIQTWFPFNLQIYLNGRECLARSMDRAGLAYDRRENCFPHIGQPQRAQSLMNRQLRFDWVRALQRIARTLNPAHASIFKNFNVDYYWSILQSEWATDVMFADPASLAQLYPAFTLHGITSFSSGDVMRFLGGKIHGNFQGQITSDFKDRPEGTRIKHWVAGNSIKLYDKQASILRVETTLNRPEGLKVFRRSERQTQGRRQWRPMRKSVVDIRQRAEYCQKANERYLEALAAIDTSTALGDLLAPISRPVQYKGKRVRGLRPWAADDLNLFQAISRGEFCVNGFRNRDLQALVLPAAPDDDKKRRSSKISRLLRLLRAHKIIRKVPRSHRYHVTTHGRELLAAILTAQRITPKQILEIAA